MAKPAFIKPIPNKIHFIWLGSFLPQKYLFSIVELLPVAQRSNFEINLWVDKESNFRKAIDKAYLMELILPHKWQIANLQIKNICELAEKMQEDSFYLTKIANETDNGPKSPFFIKNEDLFDNFWQCVRREMIGLRNLAAASDLLRYAILHQEGGYYFDTDTKFHITPDTKFISEELLFDFKVQGCYVIEKQTSSTEGKRVYNILRQENIGNISFYGGNDLIAASPHHPILQHIIKDSIDAYYQGDKNHVASCSLKHSIKTNLTEMDIKRTMRRITTYSDKQNRLSLTINYTGPGQLYNAMKKFLNEQISRYYISSDKLVSMLPYGQIGNLTNDTTGKIISQSFSKHPLQFAGINIESCSDQTWLADTQIKRIAFDDNTLPYSSTSPKFFQLQRKKQQTLFFEAKKTLLSKSVNLYNENFNYDKGSSRLN